MPYVDVSGEEIYYFQRLSGRDGSPALILVHGAGGTHLHWPPRLRKLPNVDVYALDLPGHGRSGGRPRESIQGYAEIVRTFAEAVGLKRFFLSGHSMGGAIAQTLALEHPELLEGLILVGTGAKLRVAPAILEGIKNDYQSAAELIAKWAYSSTPDPHMLELYVRGMLQVPAESTYEDFVACDRFDLMARIPEITVPTLIVCGEEDRLTPPKYCEYLRSHIPGAELKLVPHAGHMVMVEQEETVAEGISEFIARIAEGRRQHG
jgi:pimeloyl-ACP methyl ester carboxylesterase